MTKQEQIEEMAKDIVRIAGLDVYGKAEELVNLGYRKLPEDIDEIKRGLECCAAVGFKTACNVCPYCYRCNDLPKDALNIITEQEKEIERLEGERNRDERALNC